MSCFWGGNCRNRQLSAAARHKIAEASKSFNDERDRREVKLAEQISEIIIDRIDEDVLTRGERLLNEIFDRIKNDGAYNVVIVDSQENIIAIVGRAEGGRVELLRRLGPYTDSPRGEQVSVPNEEMQRLLDDTRYTLTNLAGATDPKYLE